MVEFELAIRHGKTVWQDGLARLFGEAVWRDGSARLF